LRAKENGSLQQSLLLEKTKNHVIRKEIILLENKRFAIIWKIMIGPQ
jgi:hypothetical protein